MIFTAISGHALGNRPSKLLAELKNVFYNIEFYSQANDKACKSFAENIKHAVANKRKWYWDLKALSLGVAGVMPLHC